VPIINLDGTNFFFICLSESQQEIFFVAEPDVNDAYKFDLDVATKAKYSMDLIAGAAVIENPTVLQFAELQLSFAAPSSGLPQISKASEIKEKQFFPPYNKRRRERQSEKGILKRGKGVLFSIPSVNLK
jgi:Oligosaccharyltransferase subunit Ribophorin II